MLPAILWGSVPCLLWLKFGLIETTFNPGLCLATILMFLLVADRDLRNRCLSANTIAPLALAFFLFAFATAITYSPNSGAWGRSGSAGYLLFLIMFLFGASQIPSRTMIIGTLIAGTIGFGYGLATDLKLSVAGWHVGFVLADVANTGTALAYFLLGRLVFRKCLYARYGDPVPDFARVNFSTTGLLFLPIISHLGMAVSISPIVRNLEFTLLMDIVLQPAMFVLGFAAGRRGISMAGGMIIMEIAFSFLGGGFLSTGGEATLFSSAVQFTYSTPGALAIVLERIDDFGFVIFGWVLAARLRAYHPKASSFAEALSLFSRPVRPSRPFPLLIPRALAVAVTIAMVLMHVVFTLLSASLPQPGSPSGQPAQNPIFQQMNPPERLRAPASRG
jgi:hypothetical protein